jgi:hypothetical protein
MGNNFDSQEPHTLQRDMGNNCGTSVLVVPFIARMMFVGKNEAQKIGNVGIGQERPGISGHESNPGSF